MADPFPDYDVLDKRDSLSWNRKTRVVVNQRLTLEERSDVLTPRQFATLRMLVSRVAPQPEGREPANTVAILLERIARDDGDGFRHARLPRLREAWRRTLDAIDAEARLRRSAHFSDIDGSSADEIIEAIASGDTRDDAWGDIPSRLVWSWRLLPDIVAAHWAHPSLWSAMGFGGPASPRGYVRLDADRHDPWEAREEMRRKGAVSG